MRPTTAENPPLSDHFDADHHTASLLNTDHRNVACLDTVLCDTDPDSICHRNADLRTDSLHGTDLCNTDHRNTGHCNAESFELLLERISSEGDNQAMETSVGDFEASKTREENCSAREKRSPAKMKFADAECSARLWSKRNQCWAQWLLPTGQRRSRE
jgi:hypothetical protein